MAGNRLSAVDLRMAMKAPHGAGTPTTTVPSLDWKNSPPKFEGGEDAEEAFAQSDEGRQQHHRVWCEVVRREPVELEEGAEEAACRLIRLQRIYNFLLFHAIILPVLDVYGL